jgi:DNA mismatch repair protein MutS2
MSFVVVDRLEKIVNTQAKKITRSKSGLGLNLNDKMTSFSSELDVRGKRVEEVLPILDRFINDATVLGQNNLRILHGKGHGVLREIIRNHLSSEPNVQSYQDEHIDRGGSGITLVTLS